MQIFDKFLKIFKNILDFIEVIYYNITMRKNKEAFLQWEKVLLSY